MYLHPEFEKLSRSEIEALQLERLKKTVRQCLRTEFYRERFAERRMTAEHPIEKTGAQLRAMMPWIAANKLVDKSKN